MPEIISTDKAPAAVGPYSQAVKAGQFLFISGQLAIDPATSGFVTGDIQAQTRQVLQNILAILQAGGLDKSHVVQTTVYLRNMDNFTAMNQVYASVFDSNPPARACVEVSRLPKDALVEIEAIACQ